MNHLVLSRNPIGFTGMTLISQCVKNLQSLVLDNCRFTQKDMEILANEVKCLKQLVSIMV